MSLSRATGDLIEPLGASVYEAGRSAPLALAGAFLSLFVLAAASLALGSLGLGSGWLLVGWLLLAHVTFIVAVADTTRRRMAGAGFAAARVPLWLINGLLLTVVLAAIAAAGWATGLPIGAREGQVLLLTGWAVLSLTAAPSLLLDRGGVGWPSPSKLGGRLVACAGWGALLIFLGNPLHGCRGECWGLFEGGLFALPFAGAYLFLVSLSCGILSAVFSAQPGQRTD